MKLRNIFAVYRKELKDSLRDRRTLISTIVLPTVLIPLLMFGAGGLTKKVITQAQAEVPTIAVLGGEDSPGVLAQLQADPKLKVVPAGADWKQRVIDKQLRAVVQLPAGFEAGLHAGAAEAVVVYHYEGEMKSGFGRDQVERFFRELREKNVAAQLAARALPPTLARPFETKRQNVAPPEKVGGATFGGLVPYLIIVLCFTGAMYPAIDLTAGEKERGTMETLLCSPAARSEIVLGKFLMVLTGSVAAMIFMLLSLGITAAAAGAFFVGGGEKMAHAALQAKSAGNAMPTIDPWGLVGVLAMVLPVSVLFSAVVFTVALFAKTSKEAQSYIAPLVFVVILPAVIGLLPGIELNARLALVPLLNLSLVCKEMLSGVWHWHYIALIFGSSCLYAAAALAVAVKMFNRESVMFRT